VPETQIQHQYEAFAPFYELIFQDWDGMIAEQAKTIDAIVKRSWGGERSLLDLSCGLGTQALGLAQLGYEVTGIDITAGMVKRANSEGQKRGLPTRFLHGDMRNLRQYGLGRFRTIISCENSLPHLAGAEELRGVVRSVYDGLLPGGGCIFSLRDFARRSTPSSEVRVYGIVEHAGKRMIVFQARDFHAEHCEVTWYFVEHAGHGQTETKLLNWREYPLTARDLANTLTNAGFRDVQVGNDLFEVMVTGRKPEDD